MQIARWEKEANASNPASIHTIPAKLKEPILCHLRVRCGHLFLKIMANNVPIHPYYSILAVRRKKEARMRLAGCLVRLEGFMYSSVFPFYFCPAD